MWGVDKYFIESLMYNISVGCLIVQSMGKGDTRSSPPFTIDNMFSLAGAALLQIPTGNLDIVVIISILQQMFNYFCCLGGLLIHTQTPTHSLAHGHVRMYLQTILLLWGCNLKVSKRLLHLSA